MQYILSSLEYLLSFFQREVDESEVTTDEAFFQDLQSISTFLNVSPQVIYYPGWGIDITPKKVFPRAKVIFVDSGDVAKSLQKAWCRYVFSRNPHHFHSPYLADFTILRDYALDEQSIKNTKKKWYIICDDRDGTASALYKRTDFTVVGVVTEEKVDDSFLQDYFEPATNDSDLRRAGVYNVYKKSIESVDPEVENVMDFIRKDYMKVMGTETYLWVALSVAKGDITKVLPKKRWEQDSASGFSVISNLCIFQKK